MFEVREGNLSVDDCVKAVSRDDAGAIDLFIGTVRDHNGGVAIACLEYEAYASMAEKQMRSIAEQIALELPGTRLSCQHRIGRLNVGEMAVICAASAPHRDEAFRACRLLIDRIKDQVPIWKREHGPDGPYWVGWKESLAEPEPHTGNR